MKLLMRPLNDEIKSMYHDDALETSNTNRETRGDAGLDLYCPEEIIVEPGETKKINLNISCEATKKVLQPDENDLLTYMTMPTSYFLYPRSSIIKTPLRMANSVGIIDAGYRGNIIACVDNIKNESLIYKICTI